MQQNTLQNYFNQRNQLIIKKIGKTNPRKLEEALHQLRVEIKKVEFLFNYLCFFNQHIKTLDLYKPYRVVFKTTGLIRELQLLQKMLVHYFGEADWVEQRQQLSEREIKLRNRLITHIKRNRRRLKQAGKLLQKLFEKLPVYYQNLYFTRLADNVKQHFKVIKKNDIHESRKLLKAVVYSSQIFPDASLLSNLFDIKQCNKLQDLIGKWHDKIVLKKWITNNLSEKKYAVQKRRVNHDIKDDFLKIKLIAPRLLRK